VLGSSFTDFDPGCVKSHESATIPPFPEGGYGWDASLKAVQNSRIARSYGIGGEAVGSHRE
jgi:hypothetical protein